MIFCMRSDILAMIDHFFLLLFSVLESFQKNSSFSTFLDSTGYMVCTSSSGRNHNLISRSASLAFSDAWTAFSYMPEDEMRPDLRRIEIGTASSGVVEPTMRLI